MRARTRDAFAQLLASLMVLVLGPFGVLLYFVLRPRETLAEKYERSLEEEALLQDIEERHICPGCKQPIDPDYVLCPICHTRLRQPCIHCGRLIHPRWSVCPYCAESQRPAPGVERAGRVTLLDLEREAPQPRTIDELSDDGRRSKEKAALEPAAAALAETAGQVPAEIEEEAPADTLDDDAELDWEAAQPEPAEDALKTQPLQIDQATEGANQRPLSLFRRR
jgi:RNA polymerase subunit RPABC4/transcription elongation factor Spt4